MKNIILALFVFSLVISAQVTQEDYDMINQINMIQGLTRDNTWEAGVTTVMENYTAQQRAKMCGLYPIIPTPKKVVVRDNYVARGSADLRKKMSPVKNQGSCGSCWAFAIGACIEYVNGGKVDIAEQQLVDCCKVSHGCNGGYIGSVANWVKSNPLVTEREYPYQAADGTCKNKVGQYKLNGYASVHSDSAIKSALDKGYPVDTGMKVYRDFYSYKGGVYKHTTGDYLGGHAVVIVGYNDAGKYWIIKNSWGTGWGEKGYFRMAYGECSVPWMAIYVK